LAKRKRKSACASVSLKHGAPSGSSPGLSRFPNISSGSGRATPFLCRSVKEEQEERGKYGCTRRRKEQQETSKERNGKRGGRATK
jgi:hypothetical protein